MTAGTDALAEAARLEAAAFYSQPAGDTSIAIRRQQRLDDEFAVDESLNRHAIREAVRAGATAETLMWQFAMTRAEATVALRGEV